MAHAKLLPCLGSKNELPGHSTSCCSPPSPGKERLPCKTGGRGEIHQSRKRGNHSLQLPGHPWEVFQDHFVYFSNHCKTERHRANLNGVGSNPIKHKNEPDVYFGKSRKLDSGIDFKWHIIRFPVLCEVSDVCGTAAKKAVMKLRLLHMLTFRKHFMFCFILTCACTQKCKAGLLLCSISYSF